MIIQKILTYQNLNYAIRFFALVLGRAGLSAQCKKNIPALASIYKQDSPAPVHIVIILSCDMNCRKMQTNNDKQK